MFVAFIEGPAAQERLYQRASDDATVPLFPPTMSCASPTCTLVAQYLDAAVREYARVCIRQHKITQTKSSDKHLEAGSSGVNIHARVL